MEVMLTVAVPKATVSVACTMASTMIVGRVRVSVNLERVDLV